MIAPNSALRATVERLLCAPSEARWRPDAGQPVVVYGAGGFGRQLVAALLAQGVEVEYVIDQRGGHAWADCPVPVYALDDVLSKTASRGARAVLVGVHNREVDPQGIDADLRKLGFNTVVTVVDARTALPELGDRYWLTDVRRYATWTDAVLRAFDTLADEASRQLYADVLAWRIGSEAARAPGPHAGLQYFPADVPGWDGPIRLIDGGAYDGDSLRAAASSSRRLERAWAFEPDPSNFRRLADSANSVSAAGASIECWPCAVGARTEQLRFSIGAGEASHASERGSAHVQCVALDDVLPHSDPTLIKLDVEGAEPDALRGALGIIRRYRPKLAICVYHQPEHLWSIQNDLSAEDLGYSFFLRAHAFASFDLVLYAVPSKLNGY